MKDFFLFMFLGIFSLVLQTTAFYLIPGAIHVDLILILIVYIGFTRDLTWGGVMAFCLGYMMDISSGGIEGTFCLTKLVLFFITATLIRRIFTGHLPFIVFLVFVFSILDRLIMLGILRIHGTWHVETIDASGFLLQAIATGAVTPLVFAFLRKMDARIRRVPRKKTMGGHGR